MVRSAFTSVAWICRKIRGEGVRVSQVKPSNCFRSLEKLVLPSIFDKSVSSFMMRICRVIWQHYRANVSLPIYIMLGIILSHDMNYQAHIDAIITKTSSRLYFLKILKKSGLQSHQLRHFYYSVIRPILEYCSPIWHHGLTYQGPGRVTGSHSTPRTQNHWLIYSWHALRGRT